MSYGMKPIDIQLRQQGIGVSQAGLDRKQQMDLALMDAAIRKAQMAQQGQQYGMGLDWAKEQFRKQMGMNEYQFNETRDQTDRNAIGEGIVGGISALGSIVGAGVAPGGFMLPKMSFNPRPSGGSGSTSLSLGTPGGFQF